MVRKSTRRKATQRSDRQNILMGIGFVLFLICSTSIYFRFATGWFGKIIGGFFFRLFGLMAFALPILILFYALAILSNHFQGKVIRTLIYLTGLLCCLGMIVAIEDLPVGKLSTVLAMAGERGLMLRGSGIFFSFLGILFRRLIGPIGVYFLGAFVLFFFVLHLFDLSLHEFLRFAANGAEKGYRGLKKGHQDLKERRSESKRQKERHLREGARTPLGDAQTAGREDRASRMQEERNEQPIDPQSSEGLTLKEHPILVHDYTEQPEKQPSPKPQPQGDQLTVEKLGLSFEEENEPAYLTPPFELLKSGTKSASVDTEHLKSQAALIEKTLSSFGIEAHVVSIQRGPTVTQFELKPQAGIKVSRITNLADDLALALAAQDIRIEAPIPGKPYVGVEVPNAESETVWLRDILQSDEFLLSHYQIPIALGQSIEGKPVVADITRMPHLLIAGATGSGKSVCINTIIMSILYRYAPSDVRLLLIDPKVVELSVYGTIPHLLIPVVTDPKKAARALFMLVKEMERRFQLFSQYSVRDISGYREQRALDESMENLPYIVLIVDELSDLMMVASKDVESHITRLAQMARACGIHLIIATQRPSVDVITGTIKANIPSRISFQVSSSIDSRTILDQSGAEKLLGKGDMLYFPSTLQKPKRMQGAFVTDGEVQHVVQYLSDQHQVEYDAALIEKLETEVPEVELTGGDDESRDPLMDEVMEFIKHEETTSISGLQRRFRIGYARAGRIIDELEMMGAISSQDGAKPRKIYVREEHQSEGQDESSE